MSSDGGQWSRERQTASPIRMCRDCAQQRLAKSRFCIWPFARPQRRYLPVRPTWAIQGRQSPTSLHPEGRSPRWRQAAQGFLGRRALDKHWPCTRRRHRNMVQGLRQDEQVNVQVLQAWAGQGILLPLAQVAKSYVSVAESRAIVPPSARQPEAIILSRPSVCPKTYPALT